MRGERDNVDVQEKLAELRRVVEQARSMPMSASSGVLSAHLGLPTMRAYAVYAASTASANDRSDRSPMASPTAEIGRSQNPNAGWPSRSRRNTSGRCTLPSSP